MASSVSLYILHFSQPLHCSGFSLFRPRLLSFHRPALTTPSPSSRDFLWGISQPRKRTGYNRTFSLFSHFLFRETEASLEPLAVASGLFTFSSSLSIIDTSLISSRLQSLEELHLASQLVSVRGFVEACISYSQPSLIYRICSLSWGSSLSHCSQLSMPLQRLLIFSWLLYFLLETGWLFSWSF